MLALKALEKDYRGKVKCIYIDPPYNTGAAFTHYDDNLEHSTWLSMMRPRLELLKMLLADDGLIFVQIDDNEQAYLKILMDEIFGRNNFVNCIAVKMSEASGVKMAHSEKRLPKLKEYILVYRKSEVKLNVLKIPKETWDSEYKTVITNLSFEELKFIKEVCRNESRSSEDIEVLDNLLGKAEFQSISDLYSELNIRTENERVNFNFANSFRIFRTVAVSEGTLASINQSRNSKTFNVFFSHITPKNKMYIIKGDYDESKRKPRVQVLFADEYLEYNPGDFWTDIKTTGLDNEGAGIDFKNSKKPEQLLERIIKISTAPGDLVLDSFLGSGTTVAVAHKMNRRWIGIEMGEHVYTHCKPRLDKVISGEDQGGISKSVNWQGGGSYRFMELAPTLVKFDKYDYPFINPDYTDEMLARAMALHENFTYDPSPTVFWKQSCANENTYLFVTTQRITVELLQRIQENMLPEEYLVIACKSFDAQVVGFSSRILVKLIPQSLLEKCEFGDPINAYEQVQQNIARLSQVPTEPLDFDQLLADAELAEVEADVDVEDVIQEQDEE